MAGRRIVHGAFTRRVSPTFTHSRLGECRHRVRNRKNFLCLCYRGAELPSSELALEPAPIGARRGT
jgi:hypothetical protein